MFAHTDSTTPLQERSNATTLRVCDLTYPFIVCFIAQHGFVLLSNFAVISSDIRGFTRSFHPYSSELFHWNWGTTLLASYQIRKIACCVCAGNARNVFTATRGLRSRHASRHVCDARAVMHAGIANLRFPLKSVAGKNVPDIPGACATRNFTASGGYVYNRPVINNSKT